MEWQDFCSLLLDRFGRDEHDVLLHQLLHIRQTSTVPEYITQFAELVDQLAAYESTMDNRYYTMKFIDGLRPDIRSIVLLQRPKDLDTACLLASLQEEVTEPVRTKEIKKSSFSPYPSSAVRSAHPLPPPPLYDKTKTSVSSTPEAAPPTTKPQPDSDKLAALKAYHRAMGLCYKCGEKWAHQHKCPPTVQLHVLQEVWELFQLHADDNTSTDSSELCMAISQAALTGQSAPKTLKLMGSLQGHPMVILVDSGSTHTFVSATLAAKLSGASPVLTPLCVNVANGNQLLCHSEFVDISWSVQSYTFSSTLKVLPLHHYDMILGMDWLERFSPMQIHWVEKWLLLSYNNSFIRLQGELPIDYEITSVELCVISDESVQSEISPSIQSLLDKYATVFEPPKGLPPSRACDHSIPLTQGAQPFVIRPYRYTPALKTEIETQVHQMLQEGIIRPSSSPFSSSVVMAKKKDGSWRFCIDYRFLNALTIKGKFPLPIIDEFLDELSKASWFTKLDLRSGFHQILLKAGEEYKTAFSTHFSQYEFLVMPFGVTGGPGTFQFAMNATLKPLLRQCVLVFLDDILIYSATLEDHLSHIEVVLQLLAQDGWKVKPSKCSFAQRSIAFLGHVISEAGVATDPSKISAIQSWPTPTSVKDLRSFLGLSGYYRKFVKHYGIISKPLTNLLCKNVMFVWTSEAEQSFQTLKHALITTPVLALPDFTKPFTIETDACGVGIGAVLSQQGHPLAYVSMSCGVYSTPGARRRSLSKSSQKKGNRDMIRIS